MKEADRETVVEIVENVPEIPARSARKSGGGSKKSVARTVLVEDEWPETAGKNAKGVKGGGGTKKRAGESAKKPKGRAKARSGNEKLTPAALYRKMIAFGKIYQVDHEQDFIEAARIYAEEAGLIDQMRDTIAEDGLTVWKTYKTGEVEVAHPLLSELPRHVESANKCLATIGNMIGERGARVEKAARDLDAFRLHVR